MEKEGNLPFKVGDEAEAKSFQKGFRGAWFRCKIREISKRKGRPGHVSEYYDFPGEKKIWTRLYQVPPYEVGKAKEKHRELMLRPRYPPIYNEKQLPHASKITEVTVIVDNSWKVGDLVDWWTSDCYWSGRITKLLDDDKAEIELKSPPSGEGGFYEVILKDLRPSLDWSPKHGWTVPTQTSRPCARLIKPINQVIGRTQIDDSHNAGRETDAVQRSIGSSASLSYSCPASSNSDVSDEARSIRPEMQKQSLGKTVSMGLEDGKEKSTSPGCGDCSKRKTSPADTDSGKNFEPAAEVAEGLKSNRRSQKHRTSEGVALNSMRSDTLEAAIMDLEEYVNKVKWLRKILQNGISSSDSQRPKWEFVEPHTASDIPK